MQVETPEVGAEQATTSATDLRRVSVEQLQKIHRDLDACQKVIWLAGVGSRGYGFDPSYVTDAQERLQEIEALIDSTPPFTHGTVDLVGALADVTECLTKVLTGGSVSAENVGRALIKAGLTLHEHLPKCGGEA